MNEEEKKKMEEEREKRQKEGSILDAQKGTYLVAMKITATYTQLITAENRRNAEEVADAACQKADFKRGLLDVTEIKTGTVQRGIMKKIGAQIVFFPSGGE